MAPLELETTILLEPLVGFSRTKQLRNEIELTSVIDTPPYVTPVTVSPLLLIQTIKKRSVPDVVKACVIDVEVESTEFAMLLSKAIAIQLNNF